MTDTHVRETKTRAGLRVAVRHARPAHLLLLLACAFCHVARAQSAPPPATLRLDVTVTNSRGEFVMGLEAKDFSVSLGDGAREVAYARVADAPASVGVLVDASSSMGYISSLRIAPDEVVRETVARFAGLGHESNEYFVARIGTRPELVSDWSPAGRLSLAGLNPDERPRTTALYDSVFAAVEKLKGARNPKRVVVVMSDGLDTTSEHKLEEVLRLLGEADVLVYSVGVFGGNDPGSPANLPNLRWPYDKSGRHVMEDLAAATGGRFFSPADRKEFEAAFDAIAVELRHQYEVGVRLGGEAAVKKKPLAVKVKVSSPADRRDLRSLRARTRKTYLPKS